MRDNLRFYNRLKKFPLKDRQHNEIEESDIVYDLLEVPKDNRSDNPTLKVDVYDDYVTIYVDSDIINILEYSNGHFFKIYGECKYLKFKIEPECADAIYRIILYDLSKQYKLKSVQDYSLAYNNILMNQVVFIPSKLFNKMLDNDGISFNNYGSEAFNDIVVLSESAYKYIANGEIITDEVRNNLSEYDLTGRFDKILDAYNFFCKEKRDE